MQQTQLETKTPHNLSLKNRNELCLFGVNEVISATNTEINLKTPLGKLTIVGSNLILTNLIQSSNEATILGTINEIKYNNIKKKFFEKCFK